MKVNNVITNLDKKLFGNHPLYLKKCNNYFVGFFSCTIFAYC